MVLSLVAVLACAIAAATPAIADSYGGGSVQSYSAKTAIDAGTIVQLAAKNTREVAVAKQSELQNMFGVVVDRNQLPLTLSNADLENEVFVAVSGTYNVLVSTQAGSIAVGDYLTLSSVNGVAMKAGTKEKSVFGRAVGSFDGKGVTLGSTILKDSSGKTNKTVSLGQVPVTIDIRSNPNDKSTKTKVPEFLERVGQAIAEKPVSPLRMYLSLGITAITIIAAIAILYSGVRSSMIAIGRNPMTKKSIFRALLQIIATSIIILTIGLFAVYLLLKL